MCLRVCVCACVQVGAVSDFPEAVLGVGGLRLGFGLLKSEESGISNVQTAHLQGV